MPTLLFIAVQLLGFRDAVATSPPLLKIDRPVWTGVAWRATFNEDGTYQLKLTESLPGFWDCSYRGKISRQQLHELRRLIALAVAGGDNLGPPQNPDGTITIPPEEIPLTIDIFGGEKPKSISILAPAVVPRTEPAIELLTFVQQVLPLPKDTPTISPCKAPPNSPLHPTRRHTLARH